MTQIIITDVKGTCWKFYLTKDMRLDEILECIDQQFYSEEAKE